MSCALQLVQRKLWRLHLTFLSCTDNVKDGRHMRVLTLHSMLHIVWNDHAYDSLNAIHETVQHVPCQSWM